MIILILDFVLVNKYQQNLIWYKKKKKKKKKGHEIKYQLIQLILLQTKKTLLVPLHEILHPGYTCTL